MRHCDSFCDQGIRPFPTDPQAKSVATIRALAGQATSSRNAAARPAEEERHQALRGSHRMIAGCSPCSSISAGAGCGTLASADVMAITKWSISDSETPAHRESPAPSGAYRVTGVTRPAGTTVARRSTGGGPVNPRGVANKPQSSMNAALVMAITS
jgi:hypothetical protein